MYYLKEFPLIGKNLPSLWPTGVYKFSSHLIIGNNTIMQIDTTFAVTNNVVTSYW